MSGGVDSSVAAALLASEGHDVIGVSMQLYDQHEQEGQVALRHRAARSTICTTRGARRRAIGIPHYIMNFERQFESARDRQLRDEYINGRTPIPCSHCNSDLKFATLLDRAAVARRRRSSRPVTSRASTFDEATRHAIVLQARRRSREGSVLLPVLADAGAARARAFPVGDLDKARCARSRASAACRSPTSPTATRSASCRMATTPRSSSATPAAASPREGEIVDTAGAGRRPAPRRPSLHRRPAQGPGLSSAAIPLYVVQLDAKTSTVMVGARARSGADDADGGDR